VAGEAGYQSWLPVLRTQLEPVLQLRLDHRTIPIPTGNPADKVSRSRGLIKSVMKLTIIHALGIRRRCFGNENAKVGAPTIRQGEARNPKR
jgi:hypothetical protein